jgi:hypothetical protein
VSIFWLRRGVIETLVASVVAGCAYYLAVQPY